MAFPVNPSFLSPSDFFRIFDVVTVYVDDKQDQDEDNVFMAVGGWISVQVTRRRTNDYDVNEVIYRSKQCPMFQASSVRRRRS